MSRHLSPEGEAGDELSYYALGEAPFDLSPDPRFFFASQSQARVFRPVTAALTGHDTLVMVTGSPGIGKSTLCSQIVERLPAPALVVAVTATTSDDILTRILEGVAEGADASVSAEADPEARRQQMFLSLQRRLTDRLADCRAVVLVDDAHGLRPDALDWLLVLSNLAMATVPLLRIVLVGAPQLDVMLRDARSRELAPRSVFQCRLGPLSRSEVGPYITQRLRVGSHGSPAFDKTGPLFTGAAIRALHRVSAGVPATINHVAARALVVGAGQRLRRIDGAVIRRAAEDVGLVVRRGATLRIAAATAAMALAMLMLGFFAWSWRPGGQAALPTRDVTTTTPAPAVSNLTATPSPAPTAGAPEPAGARPGDSGSARRRRAIGRHAPGSAAGRGSHH